MAAIMASITPINSNYLHKFLLYYVGKIINYAHIFERFQHPKKLVQSYHRSSPYVYYSLHYSISL